MAGGGGHRTGLAPPRHPAVNQPGIACQAHLRPKTQALHDAGTKTFDDNVGRVDELQYGLQGARLLEIERHRALAAAEDVRLHRPVRVGGSEPIHADDLGAEVSEHHASKGRRAQPGHFNYLDALQWPRHDNPSQTNG